MMGESRKMLSDWIKTNFPHQPPPPQRQYPITNLLLEMRTACQEANTDLTDVVLPAPALKVLGDMIEAELGSAACEFTGEDTRINPNPESEVWFNGTRFHS